MLGLTFFAALLSDGGRAIAADRNKCGCYKDSAGTCFCERKAKCGCSGDCEPKGCAEQRDKEIQKEIETETKKAQESDSKRTNDDESADSDQPPKPAPAPSRPKLTAAQAKQLAKLIDLYLADHPDARRKAIEDVRGEVGAR